MSTSKPDAKSLLSRMKSGELGRTLNVVPKDSDEKVVTFTTDQLKVKYTEYNEAGKHWTEFVKFFKISKNKDHADIRKFICDVNKISANDINLAIDFIKEFGDYPTGMTDEVIKFVIDKIGFEETWSGKQRKQGSFKLSPNASKTLIGRRSQLSKNVFLLINNYNLKKISVDTVQMYVDTILDTKQDETFLKLRDTIKYTGYSAEKEWEFIANYYFDLTKSPKELVISSLKKFCHQIKSKMNGEPVFNHLMPILMGPTQMGKTHFCERILCAPLSELMTTSTFKKLTDDRNAKQFEFPIIFMDEMSHSELSDMNAVKEMITSSSQPFRPMRSNGHEFVPMAATFIGTSNYSNLSEIITDPSSNRRFVPLFFRSTKPSDKDDQAALWFDPIVLWQSIDLDAEDPIESEKELLKKVQAEHINKTTVGDWFKDYISDHGKNFTREKLRDLQVIYVGWCETYKTKPVKYSSFKTYLENCIKADHPEYTIDTDYSKTLIVKKI